MLNTGERIRLARWSIPRLGSVGRKLMPKPSPSLYAAAVLIWLPRGELPDIGSLPLWLNHDKKDCRPSARERAQIDAPIHNWPGP